MKKILLLFVLLQAMQQRASCADGDTLALARKTKINLFSLADVRLLDGPFKHIMDLDHRYLLSIDPDRLASWFRREAGLTPRAAPYPFWESEDVWGKGPLAGHIMGFYMSSMAMMYESTGDTAILARLRYTLQELEECQRAGRDGYLLATINGRQVFSDVTENHFTTSNPLINDSWEPVYIMNKIMLGLFGVYTRCHLPQAKQIFVKMADWFGDSVLNKMDHAGIQKLLVCEHGSINESYIDAYLITGNKKYLNWSTELNDEDMWVPLSEGKDILNGWHANTQIPKFTGFENIFDYTGDIKFTTAARFFWETVVNKHTWSMGGNSTGEHFFALKEFENRVPLPGGPESCNSVNMLRLTEILYKDYAEPGKIDYYERVLFNHILSNYDPDSAMTVYFTSMRPGHYKVYGTAFKSFWCCTGTGMESPAKFGQMIYAYDSSSLYVNLFIPSVVNWKEKQLTLTQQTTFPDDGVTTFTIHTVAPVETTIKIRHPNWLATATMPVRINGKKFMAASRAGDYVSIKRLWKDGDHLSVSLPGKLTVESVPGGDKYVSLLYGPVVLAAKIDNAGLTNADFRSEKGTVATKEIPLSAVPSLMGTNTSIGAAIVKEKTASLSFTIGGNSRTAPVTLVPFNRIHFSRYALYFRRFADREAFAASVEAGKKEDSAVAALDNASIDRVKIGDSVSEQLHLMETVSSARGGTLNHAWRNATAGGYFMYSVKVEPSREQALYLELSAHDAGAFDVLADDHLLQRVVRRPVINGSSSNYGQTIPIPTVLYQNKKAITIKIQAQKAQATGGISDLRIIKTKMESVTVR